MFTFCNFSFTGDGKMYFTNKFIDSSYYTESIAHNDIQPYGMFAQPEPPFSKFQQLEGIIKGMDNSNVNILKFADVST